RGDISSREEVYGPWWRLLQSPQGAAESYASRRVQALAKADEPRDKSELIDRAIVATGYLYGDAKRTAELRAEVSRMTGIELANELAKPEGAKSLPSENQRLAWAATQNVKRVLMRNDMRSSEERMSNKEVTDRTGANTHVLGFLRKE